MHIPYCVKKCPYCDFNSYGRGRLIPEKEYTGALLKEIALYRNFLEGREADTVYFGGGTPSLFSPRSVAEVLEALSEIVCFSDDLECTLEVNPKTADREKLKGFRSVGVNRLSIGIQSFSDRKLKALGRIYDADDGRRVLEDATAVGFDNVSFDLMFGIPGEDRAEWECDLYEASALGSTHISCYALTIEDGTEFGLLYGKGELTLPDEEETIYMFALASDILGDEGYNRYEISNYALCGYESRHNLIYWRCGDYIGLGAGAHSHVGDVGRWGERRANIPNPDLYMNMLSKGENPTSFREILSCREALEDRLLMGLRLAEGVDVAELQSLYGAQFDVSRIRCLVDDGFVEIEDGRLRLSARGVFIANALILNIAGAFSINPYCG